MGRSLYDTCESVVPLIKQEVESETVTLNDRKFRVVIKRDERLLYFFDVTEQIQIEKLYENERTVLAYIFLDNYDDVTQDWMTRRKHDEQPGDIFAERLGAGVRDLLEKDVFRTLYCCT